MTEKQTNFRGATSEEEHRALSARGGRFKGRKGLAAMSPEKRREIARLGALRTNEIKRKKKEAREQEMDNLEA